MDEDEKYYRLALNRVEGCGRSAVKEMLRCSGTARNVFEKPELWQKRLNGRHTKRLKVVLDDSIRRAVDEEIRLLERHNIGVCHYLDAGYPRRLRRCVDAPILYYYKGGSEFNYERMVAFVGTRNATMYGLKCVTKLLDELKDSNIVTVSGLAYGIDTKVHEESLNFGMTTIAVMGCGLKTVYPSTNRNLAMRIIDSGGTVVSEFPYDMGPERVNFPQRNRIIAGMSDAVVVVESSIKGGSIITAHIAHSYNRDVFAVPGSVFDDTHLGCHNLIKKNVAAVAASGADILEMMNWEQVAKPYQTELFVELDENEERICNLLDSGVMSVDDITDKFDDMTPSRLAGLLLGLELKGVIEALPGKKYRKIRN